MRDRPDGLSIVIAATDSAEAVARSLASLAADVTEDGSIEVIVVAPADRIAPRPELPPQHGSRQSPARASLGFAGSASIAAEADRGHDRRLLRFRSRTGRVPGATPFADRDVVAATGPVQPGMGDRVIDWAVFGFEYAAFVEPASPPRRLAGNNFAFRRSIADRLDPHGIEESLVEHLARESGGRIATAGSASPRTSEPTRSRRRSAIGCVLVASSAGSEPGRRRRILAERRCSSAR